MGKTTTRAATKRSSADRMASLYAHPGDVRDILRAWEGFVGGATAVGPPVRTIVERSWQRSVRGGVDAQHSRSPMVLRDDALNELRKRNRLLCAAALPTLAENAQLLRGTRSMLVLSDATGVVLELTGDARTIESGHDINLVGGGNWNECVIGTNAIGTSIATGRAVQVHSAEHFCEGVKKWTCAAAPIHDPRDQSLLGVLDISGPELSYCQHNLALALAAARHVETTLAERLNADRASLLEACLDLKYDDRGAMILLDRCGCVVYVNDDAARMIQHGSIGKALDLGSRLIAAGSMPTLEQLGENLPPELRAEWLHPVVAGGTTLGTLLLIPDASRDYHLAGEGPDSGAPRAEASGAPLTDAGMARARPAGSAMSRTTGAHVPERDPFASIIGRSAAITDIKRRARRLAGSDAPVLIEGETGTGKELFARAIQASGAVADAPWVTYNCGTASRELIGSELFGYVKGAFTGASAEGRVGRFELADGGTLCLDEIGEMPLELQPYLLRVLDEGIVYRLGENKPRKVRVRLLALTNRDLPQEIVEGRFREDLYYRISVTTVRVPPLRERAEDIDLLVDHFNERLAAHHGLSPLTIGSGARERLRAHDWSGNVRELRNVVESLLLTGDGAPVTAIDLPTGRTARGAARSPGEVRAGGRGRLRESERQAVEAAIEDYRGNLSRAARHLGVSRSTLYRKLKRYDITVD